MRLGKTNKIENKGIQIIAIDDEPAVIKGLEFLLENEGYYFDGFTDHNSGLKKIKNGKYDLLILDYLLDNTDGNAIVKKIREFNKDLYILLLTGHSDSAPPYETLTNLNIQAYCVKSNDTSQLRLLVKSAQKAIEVMKEIKATRDGLNSILVSIPKIYQLQPIDQILEEILNGLLVIIGSENAFILVDDVIESENEDKKRSIFKGIGKFNVDISNFLELISPDLLRYQGIARTENRTIQNERSLFLPLVSEKHENMGVIFVETNTSISNVQLLEIFANNVASSLNNAFLHSLVNIKNEELINTYEVIKKRYEETVDTLRLTVDAKDEYTRGHSDRVSKYAVLLGKECNLDDTDIELLKVGGIFHDIGKIGTSDDLLFYNQKLSESQFEEIKKHTVTGANILSALSMFKDVVPLVRHHHERLDGTGYPDALKGDEIPFLAKILAVADSFDAMTSNRNYRPKLAFSEVIEQLKNNAGTQFDRNIAQKLLVLIESGAININEIYMDKPAVPLKSD